MKLDNFDDRYEYYFYGVNNLANIDVYFNEGLIIKNENCLEQSFTGIVLAYGLNKCLYEYANKHNYDNVFVIKIPAYYTGWVHRDGKVEPFVPLLLSKDGNKVIIPNLIYGVYNKNTEDYISNYNYQPIYDPSGLQYADMQLSHMYKFGYFDWYKEAFRRNSYSYEELKNIDCESQKWDRIIKHYSKNKIRRLIKKLFK